MDKAVLAGEILLLFRIKRADLVAGQVQARSWLARKEMCCQDPANLTE